jgi:hypothetical protein
MLFYVFILSLIDVDNHRISLVFYIRDSYLLSGFFLAGGKSQLHM